MKATAEQMRDQIADVQHAMNSVKSCCNGDNKIAEKRYLSDAIDELAGMVLTRKNPELTARQQLWLREARELLATSGDVAQVLPNVPRESVDLLEKLGM